MAEAGKRDQRQAENLDARALVTDLVLDAVVHHADGANLPAGVFWAAFVILDGAGRIGGVLQLDIAVVEPRTLDRGEARAIVEHDEQILDDAVAQAVGQLDLVAIGGVAFGVLDDDIALGEDLAGLAVPGDLVGAHLDRFAVHLDIALGNDDFGVAVVIEVVGGETDLVFVLDRGSVGGGRDDVGRLQVGLAHDLFRLGRIRLGLGQHGARGQGRAARRRQPERPCARCLLEQSPAHFDIFVPHLI